MKWDKRLLPTTVLIASCLAVPVMIFSPEGLGRMRSLGTELEVVRKDNEELKQSIAELRSQVRALRDDPQEVERIARDQLGMVRKSEIVFQFVRPVEESR